MYNTVIKKESLISYIVFIEKNNHMESITYYLKKRIQQSIESSSILEDVHFDSIYFDISDTNACPMLEMVCQPIPGFKKFGYRIDIPYGEQRPGNQKHMHIYKNNEEIFAINADGTAHDGYHKVKIPEKIVPFLISKGITIPPDNIIECLLLPTRRTMLSESHNRYLEVLRRCNDIAIVITNESINTTDVICNSKVRGTYDHVNLLQTIDKTNLSGILYVMQNDLTESGHEWKLIEIKDDKYPFEGINLYVVWS